MELTLDLSYLNEISGGDSEFIADILATFLEETPKDMKNIVLGIQNNDNTLIGKMAHKTKSTLQLLGLFDLKGLALQIEQTIKTDVDHPEIQIWAKEFMTQIEAAYPNIQAALDSLK